MLNENVPHVVYVSTTPDDDAFPFQAPNFLKVKTQPTEPNIKKVKDADQNLWAALGILTASETPVFLPSLVVNLDTLKMRPTEFMNRLDIMMEKMPTLTIGLLALLINRDDVTSDETAPLLPNVRVKKIHPHYDSYSIARSVMGHIPSSTPTPPLLQ